MPERLIELKVMATPKAWRKFGNLVSARMLHPSEQKAKSKENVRTEVFGEAINKLEDFETSKTEEALKKKKKGLFRR